MKKIRFDVPDSFVHHWNDLWKEPDVPSKMQKGGASVMVSGASADAKIDFPTVLHGNQDKEMYGEDLKEALQSFMYI